jgi:arsenate reductase (glutaredoxin)
LNVFALLRIKHQKEHAMNATIWHNPDCGTSRKTLAILQETAGLNVTIVEYKKTPFEREKLVQLLRDASLTPRQGLRIRGSRAQELGLINSDDSEHILDEMAKDAMLVERPFVETEKGVRLCRPQDKVLEIL